MAKFLGNVPVFPADKEFVVELRKMLAKITLSNTPGDLAASNRAPTVTGVGTTVDLSTIVDEDSVAVLTLILNGLTVELSCDFSSAADIEAVTVDEAVAAIDAAVTAAGYTDANLIDASNSGGDLVVDAKDGYLGTSASMQFTGDLAEALDLDNTGAEVNGTGAPSSVQLTVTSLDGQPVQGVNVTLKIYDASSAGSLLGDCGCQLALKGTFVSGEQSNDAVIMSDENGEADFEVVSEISGADELYLDISADADYYLSQAPASRENISKTA